MRQTPSVRSLGAFALFALAFASASAARPVLAGTILVLQHGKQEPVTIQADGNHLRMPIAGDRKMTAVIIDATANKLVMLNDKEKTYTEITEEDMKRMKAQLAVAREQIKNLPPEQRKRVEAMLGDMAKGTPVTWKFKSLGSKKTVNGMSCEMYQVLIDGKPTEEDCILPWTSNLLKKSDFTGLEKFGQTMSENLGISGDRGGIPLFHKYPGLPISRIPLNADGSRGEEDQVKSIKQAAIAPATFSVPAGYKKQTLPTAGGGGMGGPPPAAPPPKP